MYTYIYIYIVFHAVVGVRGCKLRGRRVQGLSTQGVLAFQEPPGHLKRPTPGGPKPQSHRKGSILFRVRVWV